MRYRVEWVYDALSRTEGYAVIDTDLRLTISPVFPHLDTAEKFLRRIFGISS